MDAERVLITDIDSTVFDHWRRIRRNTVPQWPGIQISNKAWTWEELAKDKLLPYCSQVLWGLAGKGFQIRYLSARGWGDSLALTIRQLKESKLPNPEDVTIVPTMLHKPLILKRLNPCDYYVDDFMTGQEKAIGTFHADIGKEIARLNITVIPFRNDWLDVEEQIVIYESRRSRT